MLHTELPTSAQTAYSQLFDAAFADAHQRGAKDLNGSFSAKKVNGRRYWYFSFRDGGKVRQIYVGPDNERTLALVGSKRAAARADANLISTLTKAYIAHGGTPLLPKHLRLISRMVDFGFFRAGGVLVGTHAFACYANMLGIRWRSAEQTMDIDLAMPGKNLSIAIGDAPTANLHDALSTFEAGFIPISSISGIIGTTYALKGEPDFQVDFLTSLGREGAKPKYIESLGITAQPLKFMEYSLEAPTQTVAFDRLGHYAIISLPLPERYAIHKLIVYGARDARFRSKAAKDLDQSAALIQYFLVHGPRTIKEAWRNAYARGPGWRKRLNVGLEALERRHSGAGFTRALTGQSAGKGTD